MIYNIPPSLPHLILLQPILVTLSFSPTKPQPLAFFQPLRHTDFIPSSCPLHLLFLLRNKLLS